jgi:hypothetical protein
MLLGDPWHMLHVLGFVILVVLWLKRQLVVYVVPVVVPTRPVGFR